MIFELGAANPAARELIDTLCVVVRVREHPLEVSRVHRFHEVVGDPFDYTSHVLILRGPRWACMLRLGYRPRTRVSSPQRVMDAAWSASSVGDGVARVCACGQVACPRPARVLKRNRRTCGRLRPTFCCPAAP